MDTASRSQALFARSREDVAKDIRLIAADHSARGLLASGATAKRAVEAFKERSSVALDQALNEVARRINHRGSKWRDAMGAIESELDSHSKRASEALAPAFKLAGCEQGSGRHAVDELLAVVDRDLRAQLKEFDEGWTSPEPKGWQERHPIVYAIGLLVIGAIVGNLDNVPFK